MKNFNAFAEALLVTTQPTSDAVAPVEGHECPCEKDQFTKAAEGVFGGTDDVTQPDDNVGEFGENEASEDSGVELECLGDDGLKLKFSDFEMVLPKSLVDKIKSFEAVEQTEDQGETSEETETQEDEESPSEEKEEHDEGSSEETEEKEEKSKGMFEAFDFKKMIADKKAKKEGKDPKKDKSTKKCKCNKAK